MMGVLLLGECWPYRAIGNSWHNSQGRLLAKASGVTVEQLETLCECRFVIRKYVASCQKTNRYERILQERLRDILNQDSTRRLHLLIGLRMGHLLGFKDCGFFEVHFWQDHKFACIPNPLADYWWKELANLEKVKEFMNYVFWMYCK